MTPQPTPLPRINATQVMLDRRRLDYFAGCDYLGMAHHPVVRDALIRAAHSQGVGVSASRKTTGNHPVYLELEAALSGFFEAPRALLASTGYTANLIAAQGLADRFSDVFLDERSHPSLRDAARFLNARVRTFRHRDPEHLARLQRGLPTRARIAVLTDGVFARDGAVAPLWEYQQILRPSAWLWVDDCHGAGILGTHGRGSLELEGIHRRHVLQVITLSKAFGTHGGAVLADDTVIDAILARSDCHAGSTPPALPIAAAALAAVEFCRMNPARRLRLAEITLRFKSQLLHHGWVDELTPGPIFPIEATRKRAEQLRDSLLKHRIFPPWIQYPGGPKRGYFRFALCSEHSDSVLRRLKEALVDWDAAQPTKARTTGRIRRA